MAFLTPGMLLISKFVASMFMVRSYPTAAGGSTGCSTATVVFFVFSGGESNAYAVNSSQERLKKHSIAAT
jgi:hypothetical protein